MATDPATSPSKPSEQPGPPGIPPAALLESSLDAIFGLDPDGHVVSWNWGAEQIYGYAREEAVGRSLLQLTIPFDRRDEFRGLVRETLETGSAFSDTTRRKKDGSIVNVQMMLRRIEDGGRRLLAVSEKDVTEQKRFEQNLSEQIWSLTGVQALLQSILDGSRDYSLIAVDLDGRIQEWNAGARRDFGYSVEEVRGQSCGPLLASKQDARPESAQAAFDTTLREGRFEGEFMAIRKDGTRFPARVTINLRKGPYDDPIGYVLILKDVTEENRAAEERRLAQERLVELRKLEEVNRLKTQLLNTVSHELNTPMTPIQVQVHLLRSGTLGSLEERQTKALDLLHRNVQRLHVIVQRVLEVARLESGSLTIQPTAVDLSALTRAVVEAHAANAAQRNVKLVAAMNGAVPVRADKARLADAVANLVHNAVKFTDPGGVVEVSVRHVDKEAVIAVRDTGRGISAEDVPKLFQAFSQVHDTMQRTDAGAGLGLYIARGIVQAHGGRIWCESPGPNKGSTFYVALPREA